MRRVSRLLILSVLSSLVVYISCLNILSGSDDSAPVLDNPSSWQLDGSDGSQPALYQNSHAMGVHHCQMSGTAERRGRKSMGRLHVLLRYRQLNTTTAAVRGVAFLEHPFRYTFNVSPPQQPQVKIAGAWQPHIFLRSPASQTDYPLVFRPFEPRTPSYVGGTLALALQDQASRSEFELRVQGWDYFCSIVPPAVEGALPGAPATSGHSATPALSSPIAAASAAGGAAAALMSGNADTGDGTGGGARGGLAKHAGGAGIRRQASGGAPARPTRSLHGADTPLHSPEATTNGGVLRRRALGLFSFVKKAALPMTHRRSGAISAALPMLAPRAGALLQTQPHVAEPRFYVLLGPFYFMSGHDFVTLLVQHMRYHAGFGITRYVVYVVERLRELLADPRAQSLVRTGRLQVILWTEFPRHEQAQYHMARPDLYAHQALIHNHQMLLRWGEDEAVVMVVDLDEYLMTPRPGMSLGDVFAECGGPDAGAIEVERYKGFCTRCGVDGGDRAHWLATAAGPHPLLAYTVSSEAEQSGKAIAKPLLVQTFRVHQAVALEPFQSVNVNRSCAVIVHIWNMDHERATGSERTDWPPLEAPKAGTPWWWAAASAAPMAGA